MKRTTIIKSVLLAATGVFLLSMVTNTSAVRGDKRVRYNSDRFVFAPMQWQTIVNNGFSMPNSEIKYSSYGQPSVNSHGLVVFRARSTQGQARQTGVYARVFPKGAINSVADLNTLVPEPNNLGARFKEFPAIPRISENNDLIAFRGNHTPAYRHTLPDGSETRVGTTGIYFRASDDALYAGASKVALAPGYDYHSVPGFGPLIAFDVFPGAPAVTDSGKIVFKGNYVWNGIGQTGIYYRDLSEPRRGKEFRITRIADTNTEIPGMPPSFKAYTFGSTSPPSVSGEQVVFLGLDNEENPHAGGIYLAPIANTPELRKLVGIGDPLPDLAGEKITRLGEGLSYDGRYVSFWGAWGSEVKTVRLYCPKDGEANLIAYCNGVDPNSIYDPARDEWYQDKEVSVNQGIFIYDTIQEYAFLISRTPADFDDFQFWVYSGRPPGTGNLTDEETVEEPPRWRSSAFIAASDGLAVFKARKGDQTKVGEYVNIIDGLYMKNGPERTPIEALAETGMASDILDPSIPTGTLPIVGLGIEREGFRGNKLAITALMADEENSWGGIYLADVARGNQIDDRRAKKVGR